jgi:hypothetical protein
MPSYKIAHILEQGVNLIIVPMDSVFGNLPRHEQNAEIGRIQMAARRIRPPLLGEVIPVWDNPSGGIAFLAPPKYFAFFENISMEWVWANVNRELSW